MSNSQEFLVVREFLNSIPLLQQLPIGSIEKIASVVYKKHYAAGEIIVGEGEPGEGIYFIWKGQAEVISSSSENEAVSYVLKAGDYFGSARPENSLDLHKSDIVATDEVKCLVLPHKHHELISSASLWMETQRKNVARVEKVLELERLDVDLFRGVSHGPINSRVFGGQFISQALAAACKSVDPSLLVHSMHSYFLRVGDVTCPILYKVERVRDGHRFATRHVTATQKGQEVFRLTASFQRQEDSVEHQESMPDAPHPDELVPLEVLDQRYRTDPRLPLEIKKKLAVAPRVEYPVEIRPCEPADMVNPSQLEPRQRLWIRAKEKLSNDQALHCCVAAYACDFEFVLTAIRPHRRPSQQFRMLSLDHSIWFHRPFRADEWLLFVIESPVASGGRGLAIGHMFTQSGQLVMSLAQEGVIRQSVEASSKL